MKSFVIISYYQLAYAIAMTLGLGEQTDLYFNVRQLGIKHDLIARIRETGQFCDVVMIDHTLVNKALNRELEKTEEMSPENNLYLYNDFQQQYYYIAGFFRRIIGAVVGSVVPEKQNKTSRYRETAT